MELADGYYIINNCRILYLQAGEWFKPLKYMGRYSGYIEKLEKQPVKIKTIDKFNTGL